MIHFNFSFLGERFILSFDTFRQLQLSLSVVNSSTIGLLLAAIFAVRLFFGLNFIVVFVGRCTYQFSP